MRRVLLSLGALALIMALTGAASAHNLTVTSPGTGEVVNVQWLGGLAPLPAQAEGEGLFFHPAGLQSAGHRHGLPMACHSTESSPAVTIVAPPFFTGCVHGQP